MKLKILLIALLSLGLVAGWVMMRTETQTQQLTNTTANVNQTLEADIVLSDTEAMTTISAGGAYVISGTLTDGQLRIETEDEDVTLILNGVDITNSSGAALAIISAGDVTIELAEDSVNILEQTGLDSAEEEKAALYSTSDLAFTGTGTLAVTSTVADGISTGDDLVITSGTIAVTSVDDGIRGKDSVTIYGGTVTVDAEDDGIKSTNTEELGRGIVTIAGGTITITSGDDALKAEQAIVIEAGTIDILSSVEGIEAPVVTINGGDITLYASDDGINASASDIITTNLSVTINAGNVTVEVGSGDTDGIDSNGSIYVNGGTVNVTNPGIGSGPATAFDYNDSAEFNGGTIYINGEAVDEIPAEQMGGRGGMMGTPPEGFTGTRPTPPTN